MENKTRIFKLTRRPVCPFCNQQTEDECPEVWIDVRGGCAELIHKPKGIIVIIKDWDNTPATEDVYTAQDEVNY